jgi:Beta propeller domain
MHFTVRMGLSINLWEEHMRVASLGTTIGLGLTLLAGCGSETGEVSASLKPLKGCGEVQSALKSMALSEMNRRIDENLERALSSGSSCSLGGSESNTLDSSRGGVPMSASAPQSGSTSGGGGGATQTSTTNNQVAGVDEADFIKNDNKYLYVVSGQHFRIIKAWPAAATQEVAKVKLEGTPKKLVVTKDRALIYTSLGSTSTSGGSYSRGECTYGYSCRFTGDGNPTLITVWDITDRKAPSLVRKIRLTGSYINARRVGSAVFTVLHSPGVAFPNLRYYPQNVGCGGTLHFWLVTQAYEKLRAENTKIIQQTTLKDWLPSVDDTIVKGASAGTTSKLLAGCKGFYRSSLSDGGEFTTLLALDMDRETPASSSTIVSRPGAVYASGKALYMAVPHERSSGRGWYGSMRSVSEASTVHKFRLSPSSATAAYAASGVVKGRALNQFAMDEQDDFLRMATTSGRVPASAVHSTLTVMQQRGLTLDLVGQLDNLAPTEDIRSVRFAGDRGYVVTFKKTDPLFVFDLSQPRQPRVMAELKIPGFSTYMHMLDDKHLLTIGYDANDQGSFAWFTGVMLQIFNVSDPKHPRLAHKHVIGTRGSSSAALNNHLAFNYFAPKDLLALPMTVCEGSSGGGSYGKTMTFSGLMVFDTTAASGFSLRGKVDHPAGKSISCSNWWTNAESQVERSVFMDDFVFSISRSAIKVNSLKDLSQDLVSLSIAD